MKLEGREMWKRKGALDQKDKGVEGRKDGRK